MQVIPRLILQQLYNRGSLRNTEDGVHFIIKNRLSDAKITAVQELRFNNQRVSAAQIRVRLPDGHVVPATHISEYEPISFALKESCELIVATDPLPEGKYEIEVIVETKPFGLLHIRSEDTLAADSVEEIRIPRAEDDYAPSVIEARQQFIEDYSQKSFQHIKHYSIDPHTTQGNVEHFVGVAQIPLGLAGPLRVNGEYAQGEFVVPMATSEGTLVASYNRGMKVINRSGGVKCTVIGDSMQRAPVFVFADARGAREFVRWINEHFDDIAHRAEATSSVAKLQYIDSYLANKFAYLRFNFSTGDAAGQNMVGRATFAACSWILDTYQEYKIEHFYLESNFATDKKASQVNMMHTRGKRVVAELTIPREVLIQLMRVEPEKIFYHAQVSNVGSILAGANNNGCHSANGITAMFIATGQDVANVAESSAGIMYTELTPEKDLYLSMTIPSLIVATYGGGTGLATQRECLEMMDCYGRDRVNKFAEIVAGVVMAGEISLASAISSSDWVSSHERYGRNR